MFKNRKEVGILLADKMLEYNNKNSVIFAIPTGGVSVAYEISKRLFIPLRLIFIHKIFNPKYTKSVIGVISKNDKYFINDISSTVDRDYLDEIIKKEKIEILRRIDQYPKMNNSELNLKGKTAIIVDDGVATGLTLFLAIKEIIKLSPAKIVLATPIISSESFRFLNNIVNKIIYIDIIRDKFGSISDYYKRFNKVSDKECIEKILKLS